MFVDTTTSTLPQDRMFEQKQHSYTATHLGVLERCPTCQGLKPAEATRPKHICPGKNTKHDYQHAWHTCKICEARMPPASNAVGNRAIKWQHEVRCRQSFPERWSLQSQPQEVDALAAAMQHFSLAGSPSLEPAFTKGSRYLLQGFKERPELNGCRVLLLHWTPPKEPNAPLQQGDAVTYSGFSGRVAATILSTPTNQGTVQFTLKLESGQEKVTDGEFIQASSEGRWKVQTESNPDEHIFISERYLSNSAMEVDAQDAQGAQGQPEHTDERAEYFANLCDEFAGWQDHDMELPPPKDIRQYLHQLTTID
eukprot:gene3874-1235_t